MIDVVNNEYLSVFLLIAKRLFVVQMWKKSIGQLKHGHRGHRPGTELMSVFHYYQHGITELL